MMMMMMMFKMSAVCSDTSTGALRPYAILIPFSRVPFSRMGTSSPRTRDGIGLQLLICETPDFIPQSL